MEVPVEHPRAVGGAVIIENRFLFPHVALDTLEREAATGFAGVPSTFAILLNRTNLAERALTALRYVTQAGGPMAPELTRRLIAALPGKRIFVMYGATEASARLTYVPPEDLPGKIGSVGRAIPGVTIEILRQDGSPAETGEIGEVVAAGPNIMEGYWNDPVETAAVLDAKGYHTGDLGRLSRTIPWLPARRANQIRRAPHSSQGDRGRAPRAPRRSRRRRRRARRDPGRGDPCFGPARSAASTEAFRPPPRAPRVLVPKVVAFRGECPPKAHGKDSKARPIDQTSRSASVRYQPSRE
jgi:hypothetical protein